MPLQYAIAPGTVVLCNYSTGFRPPEMVKRRPAVVISPRLPHRDRLCTVVPLSGTPPTYEVAYQCRIELNEALPPPFEQGVWWAKADMLATVSFDRLDCFAPRAIRKAVGGDTSIPSSRTMISGACSIAFCTPWVHHLDFLRNALGLAR